MSQQQGRATQRIQGCRRSAIGKAAVDKFAPPASCPRPGDPFQTGPEVHRQAPRMFGVPEKNDVADFIAQVVELQSDSGYLAAAPLSQVSAQCDMACVQADSGQDRQPSVESLNVIYDLGNGFYARDVHERRQETVPEFAVGISFGSESDHGLREETLSVGQRPPVLEQWVEGLDRGDRQVCVAPPAQGEALIPWDALRGETPFDPRKEITPPQMPPRWVVGRSPVDMLDRDSGAAGGDIPARPQGSVQQPRYPVGHRAESHGRAESDSKCRFGLKRPRPTCWTSVCLRSSACAMASARA